MQLVQPKWIIAISCDKLNIFFMKLHRLKTLLFCLIVFIAYQAQSQLFNYTDATDVSPSAVAANITATDLSRYHCDTSLQCPTGFRSDHTSKLATFSPSRSATDITVTADVDYTMIATSISVDVRRNIKGPGLIRFLYSTDAGDTWYTNGVDLSYESTTCDVMTTLSWDFDDITTDGSILFKVIYFGSAGVNGTIQLKNLVISGSVVITDGDGDGYSFETDCNDADASIHPDATEVCNGVDDNCDGFTDEGVLLTFYADADGDGYGDISITTEACEAPDGYVSDNTDCNDEDASINPGAAEICNGIDENCNGVADEDLIFLDYYTDADDDGYGDMSAEPVSSCSPVEGSVTDNTDCNDGDASINPGAEEICNGVDDNCDGNIDEGVTTTFYADADGDGYGDAGSTTEACELPEGYVTDNTDCNDADATINPEGTEICNGMDDDCDGTIDEDLATASITIGGPTEFCHGIGVLLTANTGDGYTYQWFNDGLALVGETESSVMVYYTAYVSVVVTLPGGCSAESDVVATTVMETPVSNVILGDETNDLCFDASIKLKANVTTGVTYQWYKSMVALAGETNYLYYATTAGNYKIEQTSIATGCTNTSDPYTIIATCREGQMGDNSNGINQISVYPNPVTDDFTVDATIDTDENDAVIELINVIGEVVYAGNAQILNGSINERITLDDSITGGIYIVRIKTGSLGLTKQIMIQK